MLDRFDGLTGLYDEDTFYNKLSLEIKRMIRYKGDLSVMVIEPIFETTEQKLSYLYPSLRALAEILKANLRAIDIPCRLKGELAIIFPNTNVSSLRVVTARLVSKYESFINRPGAILEAGGKALKFYIYSFGSDFTSVEGFKEALAKGENAVIYELRKGEEYHKAQQEQGEPQDRDETTEEGSGEGQEGSSEPSSSSSEVRS